MVITNPIVIFLLIFQDFSKKSIKLVKLFCVDMVKFVFSNDEIIRHVLYNIHLFLVMIIECAYRTYADDSQYNWAKEMLQKEVNKM